MGTSKYISACCLIVALSAGISCKKSFLDIIPKGKLIAQKTSDYDLLLNGNIVGNAITAVPMGDEVAAIEPYLSAASATIQRQFNWQAVINEPNENSQEISAIMPMIYTYNKIINEVPESAGGTEQQKRSVQAEAMAGRAWCYFMLINYFAKPYNVASAATDPGFPIVSEARVTETKFSRAPVQEVYDFIIKDLSSAIPSLSVSTVSRVRMSRTAAQTLLGKVYMFMGRFTDALPLLDSAMKNLGSTGVPMALYDYNVTFGPGGSFLPISSFGPTYPTAADVMESMYVKYAINSYGFTSNVLAISPETGALYDASDLRLNFFKTVPASGGVAFPAGMFRRRGPVSLYYGIVVPDLYLLRAECRARLNDLDGAKADLETLREKRMPAANASVPDAVASQQIPLLRFIFDERVREFAVQGFRWFDMRRLSVDPMIKQTVFTHKIYTSPTAFTTLTLPAERLVWRFPQKLMDENPGMENNP